MDNKEQKFTPYIFNESTYLKYCKGAPPGPAHQDFKDLCQEAVEWPNQICDIDPISQDTIPPEYLLRFRIRTSPTHSVLACRDVTMLKALIDRDGMEAKDPIHRLTYSRELHKRVANHPAVKQVEHIPYDLSMLTEDLAWGFQSAVYAYRPEFIVISNGYDTSMTHKKLSRYVVRGIVVAIIFFAFTNREYNYSDFTWKNVLKAVVVGAVVGVLYYWWFVYEPPEPDD